MLEERRKKLTLARGINAQASERAYEVTFGIENQSRRKTRMFIEEFNGNEYGPWIHGYQTNRFQRMAIRFLFRFVLRNTELEPDTCLYIATDRKSVEDIVHAEDSLRKKYEEKKES